MHSTSAGRSIAGLLVALAIAASSLATPAVADERTRNAAYFNRRPVSKDAVAGWRDEKKSCVRKRLSKIENDPKQRNITRGKLDAAVEACR